MENERTLSNGNLANRAWMDFKIAGAAVLESISYVGFVAGSPGRYAEDNRLQILLAERLELLGRDSSTN